MQPIKKYFSNPNVILLGLLTHFGGGISDKIYLKLLYRLRMGKKLNLKNPSRFTEKLQWLKLYYRKPEFTRMVDKITAKEYVANILGNQFIIPTLGIWQHFDDIDFNKLPDKFVLKTNHSGGGGGVIICKDKNFLDKPKARNIIERSLKHKIYPISREWPYKDVKPMILAEDLLEDDSGKGLIDYKFFCFDGIPKVMLIATNRFSSHNFNYFDMDFRPLPIVSVSGAPADYDSIAKPAAFEEMKDIAKKLSSGLPHLRVDLYEAAGRVYFGELTFFDSSGFDNLNSDTVDLLWGSWMTLPSKTNL